MHKLTSDAGAPFEPSVFNWRLDRDEKTDLYDSANSVHNANVERLLQYKEELIEGYETWLQDATPQLPSQAQEELLRSLGYIE